MYRSKDTVPLATMNLFDKLPVKQMNYSNSNLFLKMNSFSNEENNPVSLHTIQQNVILEFIDRIQKEVSRYTTNEKYSNRPDIDSRLHQCQRIEKIFNTCVQYIKLASHLPTILIESPATITASIPTLQIASLTMNDIPSKREEFDSVLGHYLTVFGHQNRPTVSNINDFQVKITFKCQCLWPQLIDFLIHKQLSVGARIIIALLSELKRIAEHKIQTSASLELAKQKVLHQIWSNNDVNVRKITSIIRGMAENQANIQRNTTVKRNDIQAFKLQAEQLQQKSDNEFTRLM